MHVLTLCVLCDLVLVSQGSVNFSRLTNVKPTGRELYILYHKKVSTTKVNSMPL